MKRISILLLFALAGCGSLDMKSLKGSFENRVTVTMACDRGFFASLWGPFGFTSEIDQKDVALLPCAKK